MDEMVFMQTFLHTNLKVNAACSAVTPWFLGDSITKCFIHMEQSAHGLGQLKYLSRQCLIHGHQFTVIN